MRLLMIVMLDYYLVLVLKKSGRSLQERIVARKWMRESATCIV